MSPREVGSGSLSMSSRLTAEWPVTNNSSVNYLLPIHRNWDKKYGAFHISDQKTVHALRLPPVDGTH